MTLDASKIDLPAKLSDKSGLIIVMLIIFFLLWLSNTGRLSAVENVFKSAGHAILPSVVPPAVVYPGDPGNPIMPLPISPIGGANIPVLPNPNDGRTGIPQGTGIGNTGPPYTLPSSQSNALTPLNPQTVDWYNRNPYPPGTFLGGLINDIVKSGPTPYNGPVLN